MAETVALMIDLACWWTGALVLGMGALLGASAVLWWIAERMVRSGRLWARFYEAMVIMHARRNRGAG